MKKNIIILLLVILPILVNAEETVDVKIEYVKDVYWNFSRNNTLYSGNLAYFYVNDKIAYSMDLDVPFNSNVYIKTNKKLSSNIIYNYVYFGYGYNGNNTLEDYMATQKILWKYTDSVQVFFTTKPNGEGETIDVSYNEKEIKERFNEYARFPDYGNLKFIIESENIIDDINSVQSKFYMQNESKNDINLDSNNALNFKANEFGKSKFYLQKKFKYNYENVFYISDNSPELLVVGNVDDIKKSYLYEVIGGSICINVSFDEERDKSITSNIFKLYNSSDKLIGIYSPDEDGNIKIGNLKEDNYILRHDVITEGYDILEKEYIITVDANNLNVVKNVNLLTKQTKLIIKKTHSNVFTKNIEYDKDVLYKIYDEDNNYINEFITDENGIIETSLKYGNYKILESNTDRELFVDKSMFNDTIEFIIHNKIYNSNLKIITLNKNTKEVIPNIKFKINEKEYITNEKGIYVLKNMDFGIYEFKNISNNSLRNINLFVYELTENSDVYIENREPYVDIYLHLNIDNFEEEKNKPDEIVSEDKENNINDNNSNVNGEIIFNGNEIIENDDLNTEVDNKKEEVSKNENIDNSVTQEEESNYEKGNSLVLKDKLTDGVNNLIIKDDVFNNINNSKLEVDNKNEEKLPFLGDNVYINENNKIITYIYNIIKFSWL